MAAGAAEFFYYPFGVNWHHDSQWRREIARSPNAARAALRGYRRVLTDGTIFRQNWIHHSLVTDYMFVRNRWRMLETGAVLARLPALGEYPTRLLCAGTYPQACAELRAALLLARMGLRIRRDPSNVSTSPQTRWVGPDWLALDTAGFFGAEVKCPGESDLLRGRSSFVSDVVFTAMNLLGGDRAINLTLDPATVAEGAIGAWSNTARAESLTVDALAEAEATGSAAVALGSVVTAPPGFSSMIGPIPSDEEHEAGRLRDLLLEAAEQLREWAPGIVIVDSSLDRWVMRRCCRVAEMMEEHWASDLALVMLVADTCPGFVTTIVPGPRFDEFASARIRGPRVCSKGHLHVDTFGKPDKHCMLDDIFEDYPAFCIPGIGHRRANAL